jgi:hypothetical protein
MSTSVLTEPIDRHRVPLINSLCLDWLPDQRGGEGVEEGVTAAEGQHLLLLGQAHAKHPLAPIPGNRQPLLTNVEDILTPEEPMKSNESPQVELECLSAPTDPPPPLGAIERCPCGNNHTIMGVLSLTRARCIPRKIGDVVLASRGTGPAPVLRALSVPAGRVPLLLGASAGAAGAVRYPLLRARAELLRRTRRRTRKMISERRRMKERTPSEIATRTRSLTTLKTSRTSIARARNRGEKKIIEGF